MAAITNELMIAVANTICGCANNAAGWSYGRAAQVAFDGS
jgi:hypothetical protein